MEFPLRASLGIKRELPNGDPCPAVHMQNQSFSPQGEGFLLRGEIKGIPEVQ